MCRTGWGRARRPPLDRTRTTNAPAAACDRAPCRTPGQAGGQSAGMESNPMASTLLTARPTWWGDPDVDPVTEPPSLLGERQAGLELLELIGHPVYYGIGVPRGRGAPVLLLPGFLGSDAYLLLLHGWLR